MTWADHPRQLNQVDSEQDYEWLPRKPLPGGLCCFLCGDMIDSGVVAWYGMKAYRADLGTKPELVDGADIYLHTDCALTLGTSLISDGSAQRLGYRQKNDK